MFYYLKALVEQWSYSLIYYATCAQFLFTENVKKPTYRILNFISPPKDNELHLQFCKKTKQLTITTYDSQITPPNHNENDNLYIIRHQHYCPIKEYYKNSDLFFKKKPENKVQPTLSNIRFLEIELSFRTTDKNKDQLKKSISLYSPIYNYYMVGNIICSDFIDYFIHTHHPDWIQRYSLILPLQYTMILLDHNVKMNSLTHKDAILLKPYDYEIINEHS
ncbi:hypothetical protein N9K75_01080 [bacterium]|nr:hypothetical protein [bacterium]